MGIEYFGGDAVNGHIENGQYFLRDHGKVVEVSRAVYTYSYVHAVTVMITTLATFAVFLWWFGRQLILAKPARMSAESTTENHESPKD